MSHDKLALHGCQSKFAVPVMCILGPESLAGPGGGAGGGRGGSGPTGSAAGEG
jgi:hypothetical protein